MNSKGSSTHHELEEILRDSTKNDLRKLQIRAKSKGCRIKVAQKNPSNKSPQQISRDLYRKAKNKNSSRIAQKILEKKDKYLIHKRWNKWARIWTLDCIALSGYKPLLATIKVWTVKRSLKDSLSLSNPSQTLTPTNQSTTTQPKRWLPAIAHFHIYRH